MRIMKLFKRVIFIFLISLGILIGVVQEDAWVKQWLQDHMVTMFKKSFHCSFNATVAHISLLSGVVELKDVSTCPQDAAECDAWSWKAPRIFVKISWYRLLRGQGIEMSLTVDDIQLFSQIKEGKILISDHIKGLLQSPPLSVPFVVKDVRIRQGAFSLNAEEPQLQVDFTFKVDSFNRKNKKKQKINQISAAILSLRMLHAGKIIIDQVSGASTAIIMPQQSIALNGILHGSVPVLGAPNNDCTLSVHIAGNLLTAQLSSSNTAWEGYGMLNMLTGQIHMHYRMPIAALEKEIGLPQVEGDFSFNADGNVYGNVQGSLVGEQVSYKNFGLPKIETTFIFNKKKIEGITTGCFASKKLFSADWNYQIDKHKLMVEKVVVPETALEAAVVALHFGGSQAIGADYTITCSSKDMPKQNSFQGTAYYDGTDLVIDGIGENSSYSIIMGSVPSWHVKQVHYIEGDKAVIQISGMPEREFEGRITYSFLRSWITRLGVSDIPGEGIIEMHGSYNAESLQCKVALCNGNIRLPYTYNIVQGFSGEIELWYAKKMIRLKNMCINLYKGTIEITQATIIGELSGALHYLFVPVRINSCLFNFKKDLFALFSGFTITEYRGGSHAPRVYGALLLDKSHIKGNVLSPEFQRDLMGGAGHIVPFDSTELHIGIGTRELLHVKTSFLETHARINCLLKGTVAHPQMEGRIELINGSMNFPYKPLFIQRGALYFDAQSGIDNPEIDLVAQNTLKKYEITLAVTGSLRDPQLHFDASPALQEEQIMTLLLGGSEDGSFFLAMPSSISNSVENLLFGPAESSSKWQKYLKNLFKPLKNVRIVPGLSDQSGRGGLRGALAIEVNDRWRAMIQQNFSLTEDTRFEIEYALSDDTSVRVFQDERSDLGGEMEMRWKF